MTDSIPDDVEVLAAEPIVQADPSPNLWHAYGPLPDGGTRVQGPTTVTVETMATIGDVFTPPGEDPAPYLGHWEHKPTAAELASAIKAAPKADD